MKAIAETFIHSWYDSSVGCNSMRERLEIKWTSQERALAGTKLYAENAVAALIADRAELLEALQRLATHRPRTSEQIDADWDAARAAIARATGEGNEPTL